MATFTDMLGVMMESLGEQDGRTSREPVRILDRVQLGGLMAVTEVMEVAADDQRVSEVRTLRSTSVCSVQLGLVGTWIRRMESSRIMSETRRSIGARGARISHSTAPSPDGVAT